MKISWLASRTRKLQSVENLKKTRQFQLSHSKLSISVKQHSCSPGIYTIHAPVDMLFHVNVSKMHAADKKAVEPRVSNGKVKVIMIWFLFFLFGIPVSQITNNVFLNLGLWCFSTLYSIRPFNFFYSSVTNEFFVDEILICRTQLISWYLCWVYLLVVSIYLCPLFIDCDIIERHLLHLFCLT